jgi:hypothetical protein
MKANQKRSRSSFDTARKNIPWILVGCQFVIIVVLWQALATTKNVKLPANVCTPQFTNN